MKIVRIIVLLSLTAALVSRYSVTHGQSTPAVWNKQFGTSADDFSSSITLDSQKNIIVDGSTQGVLFGAYRGGKSFFLAKYDTNGSILWSKELGSSKQDYPAQVVTDQNNNIYVVGTTEGSLFGPLIGNSRNASIVKYSANGNQLWAKQFGAPGNDTNSGLALDSQGNIYVVGGTTELFGANNGDDDAFLAKFGSDGTLIWGKKFGGQYADFATALCVKSNGTIYVTGNKCTDSSGIMNSLDGFLSKFDASGNVVWTRALVSTEADLPEAIHFDVQGNVLVGGYTAGSLFAPNAGAEDIFLAAYDAKGNLVWSKQYGTSAEDELSDFTVDNQGSIYIAGDTHGDLFGPNAGGDDAFIQKLSPTGQMASAKPTRRRGK